MKQISILFLCFCLSVTVSAQKIHKAKQSAAQLTNAQNELIKEGARLHDAKKYNEAIAKYERILSECSGCVEAMYGIGLSYYAKKDFPNALKYLEEATKFKSRLLPDVYRLIGSIVDDKGDRKKALKIYGKALKIAPDNAILHYDMGFTYARMSKFVEARKSLKKSVELEPGYVSPHYILAEVFLRTKYRIPAMLSAARVLSLEADTPRSKRAKEIFMSVFRGNVEKGEKPGSLNIFLNLDAPDDEGDFGTMELVLGISEAVDETEGKKDLTAEQKFVSKLKTVIAIAGESEMKSNFVKDQYFSFLEKLKKEDYVEPFAYLIMHQNGNKKAEAWISANGQKTVEFMNWSKAFRP